MARTGIIAILLAVVLITGCTATEPSSDTTNHSPTSSCVPLTTSYQLNSDVRHDYPDTPDEIDRSSVREYVDAFERAYAWNRKYRSNQDRFNVDISGIDVEPRDDGYFVHIDEVRVSQYFEDDNSIADDAWSAHYFVNESVVRRGQGHAGGPIPSDPEWQTIRC